MYTKLFSSPTKDIVHKTRDDAWPRVDWFLLFPRTCFNK